MKPTIRTDVRSMSPYDVPVAGLVVRYAYLWKDQAAARRIEGVKDRPVVIVAVQSVPGSSDRLLVSVCPITHSAPREAEAPTIALKRRTRARLGLDAEPVWIVASELNRFIWPGPDLRSVPGGGIVCGPLPDVVTEALRTLLLDAYRAGGVSVTTRSGIGPGEGG